MKTPARLQRQAAKRISQRPPTIFESNEVVESGIRDDAARMNPDPHLKSERGANLEQRVLASTRKLRSQIADSIFWNLRFAICNPEGHVFAAEGLVLAHAFSFYCGIRDELNINRVPCILQSCAVFAEAEMHKIKMGENPRSHPFLIPSENCNRRTGFRRDFRARPKP